MVIIHSNPTGSVDYLIDISDYGAVVQSLLWPTTCFMFMLLVAYGAIIILAYDMLNVYGVGGVWYNHCFGTCLWCWGRMAQSLLWLIKFYMFIVLVAYGAIATLANNIPYVYGEITTLKTSRHGNDYDSPKQNIWNFPSFLQSMRMRSNNS
ncbi:hypothetical protein CEXT_776701 [Caerostris extrusa]|uniref:Uncharacterized protein n=1 Tax=Caerostris extrusa TaxID=172846 RepID=A0AAV4WGS6_CAEEX|nr:hypothetical protein CEXT_776701 [Caerostris extrusa]